MNLRKMKEIKTKHTVEGVKAIRMGSIRKIAQKQKNEVKDKSEDSHESIRQFELCALCGKTTDVPVEQEIAYRAFYIEGAGQLCYVCYHEIYG